MLRVSTLKDSHNRYGTFISFVFGYFLQYNDWVGSRQTFSTRNHCNLKMTLDYKHTTFITHLNGCFETILIR